MEIEVHDSMSGKPTALSGTSGVLNVAGNAVSSVSGNIEKLLSTAGSAWAAVVSDYRGLYPASYYKDLAGSATAQTAVDLIPTVGDATNYDALAFELYTLSAAGAVKVYPSFDGVTFSATPIAITNLIDGSTIAGGTGITAIGNYMVALPVKCRDLKISYAGASANTAIRGAMWKR